MKKLFLTFFVLLSFSVLIVPNITTSQTFNPAKGIVPCGNPGQPACEIKDFFIMLAIIYDFLVKWIATPLAILGLTIGAIFILISAGNPSLNKRGWDIVWAAVIGLALVFCSWLIINTLLSAMGYQGAWNVL